MRTHLQTRAALRAVCLAAGLAAFTGCGSETAPGPPARIERAYGDAQRGSAGEPLPLPLVVRVLDAGGSPLAGVAVDWRTTDAGRGAVHFGGRTDRYGYARAVWILGPAAGGQAVAAVVAGLPPVPFTATAAPARGGTPAAAPRLAAAVERTPGAGVVAPPAIVPAGPARADSATVPATAQDSAPTEATPPPVPPRLAGRLFTADGGAPAALRAALEDARGRTLAAVPVDAEGRFTLPLPGTSTDSLALVVAPAADAVGAYFPSVVPLPPRARPSETSGDPSMIGIVLVPRRWTITAGSYAGQGVAVDVRAAFRAPCNGCAAFLLAPGADDEEDAPVRAWADTVFPLRVVMDRPGSVEPIDAPDSAAFWREAEALERTLGERLFRPAMAPAGGAPASEGLVLVRLDPSQHEVGLSLTAAQRGRILAATVSFRHGAVLSGPDAAHVVQHELMHALGLGHTCGWRSVLADTERCPDLFAKGPTARDVAYLELLQRVKAVERREGAVQGLRAARRGAQREAAGAPAAGASRAGLMARSGSR